jgi:sialate O-acetylesterase
MKKSLFIALLSTVTLRAEVKLPALISDHMLIQQQAPVRIWGSAAPGEAVKVAIQAQTLSATAGSDGKWEVFLAPMAAGGPYELMVSGTNSITVHDVLAGEVWVGSGQSNMEFAMARVKDFEREIPAANYPQIRLFTVKRVVAAEPAEDVQGSWSACTPDTVKSFSAVAYFFGRELHQTRHVPVGLIHSSWGGTPAQAWTEKSFLDDDQNLHVYRTNWDKTLTDFPAKQEDYEKNVLPKWEQQVAAAKQSGAKAPAKPGPPVGPGHPNTPTGLYNGMIAPLTPYAIRGVIWYQGESNANANEARLYRRLFPAMIESWRKQWGQGSFPFYFVQLANFQTNGWWPMLRESQTETLELAHTGQALAIDVGNRTDIHPTDKQTVGHRLALVALAQTYGEQIVSSGPSLREMTLNGADATIWFDNVGKGLEAKGGALTGFAVAGADQKFVPATAKIVDNRVVVSSPDVKEPKAVRYAWADYPMAALYNGEGLPAVPFRTDTWQEAKELKFVTAP